MWYSGNRIGGSNPPASAKMLKIKPFKQKPSSCGPASLKMVLGYYGVTKSEKELGRLSGCTKAHGTKTKGLLKAAKHSGFTGFIKDFSDIKDIRHYVTKKKIQVIVNLFSVSEGLSRGVAGIDKEKIYLEDPEFGRMRSMLLNDFKAVWFDFSSPWLKSKSDLVIRRMPVVVPKTKKLG